jgi:hypothetical protein
MGLTVSKKQKIRFISVIVLLWIIVSYTSRYILPPTVSWCGRCNELIQWTDYEPKSFLV